MDTEQFGEFYKGLIIRLEKQIDDGKIDVLQVISICGSAKDHFLKKWINEGK